MALHAADTATGGNSAMVTHGKGTGCQIQFIEPMYALGVRTLPEGPDWLYEIKLDAYRCLAGKIPAS